MKIEFLIIISLFIYSIFFISNGRSDSSNINAQFVVHNESETTTTTTQPPAGGGGPASTTTTTTIANTTNITNNNKTTENGFDWSKFFNSMFGAFGSSLLGNNNSTDTNKTAESENQTDYVGEIFFGLIILFVIFIIFFFFRKKKFGAKQIKIKSFRKY